ncbi:piwi-like protein 1 isoform X1 [Histomonas meleagridis]|uniref:piwi-like protein 1 isoform X1 n=1 Tax=Histomonas meleagridis TaxID=135588 RepID=UPI00355AC261|nr:piwi-like protein 1 isoform X1 [Histomonas meleagridis]KAH0802603.1 piwi-like protein 1 isoform X1 [Histomonas meleagridis]
MKPQAKGRRMSRNKSRDEDESCYDLRVKLGDNDTVPREIHFSQNHASRVQIETNVYDLTLSQNKQIYQYTVTLIPEILSPRLINHYLYTALCPEGGPMGTNERWQNIIFDGQHILYTTYPDLANEYPVKPSNDSDKEIIVKIDQARQISPDDIQSLLTIYNTTFHKAYHTLGLTPFRQKWIDDRSGQRAGGFSIKSGFIPSVAQLSSGLSYLIDTASRIDRQGTLTDYLSEGINNPNRRQFLEESIRSLQLQTSHMKKKQRQIVPHKILWDQKPQTQQFDRYDPKTKETTKMTISQYFEQVYNHKCRNNDVLIDIVSKRDGKENHLLFPSSVISISGITDAERRSGSTMRDIAKHTKMTASERKQKLDNFVNTLKGESHTSTFLKNWGFEIGQSKKVDGYQIQAPTLSFTNKSGTIDSRPDDKLSFQGKWREYGLYQAPQFKSNILLVTLPEQRGIEQRFRSDLEKVSTGLGIHLPQIKVIHAQNPHPNSYNLAILEEIDKNGVPSFIICLLRDNKKEYYDKIKEMLTVNLGMPSQCIVENTISRSKGLSVATNIAIQIASKIKGVPTKVSSHDISLGHTMVIGLSITISRGSSPVCAGTASTNNDLSQFHSRSFGLQPGQNIIPNDVLCEFLTSALDEYKLQNGEFPKRIVVYREGVSYGQMPKLKENEVKSITETLEKVTGDSNISLVYMIAQKHGSVRIMKVNGNSVVNADAGTVVTDQIGAKGVAEFYLVSHHANQGSATPTRYTIIHHSPVTWEDDQLILLTHYQTLQYPNWPGAIRIPACLMLAGRLAEMTKSHLGSNPPHQNLWNFLHFL